MHMRTGDSKRLHLTLSPVHRLIRPAEDVLQTAILRLVVQRIAEGGRHAPPGLIPFLLLRGVEFRHQCLDVRVILVLQDHDELIPADAE